MRGVREQACPVYFRNDPHQDSRWHTQSPKTASALSTLSPSPCPFLIPCPILLACPNLAHMQGPIVKPGFVSPKKLFSSARGQIESLYITWKTNPLNGLYCSHRSALMPPGQYKHMKLTQLGYPATHLPPGYHGPLLGPPPPSRWPTPKRLLLRDIQGRFRKARASAHAVSVRFHIASRWPKL